MALTWDSLQTNPGCRRGLLLAAAEILGDDPEILVRLLGLARSEFTHEDAFFAEASLARMRPRDPQRFSRSAAPRDPPRTDLALGASGGAALNRVPMPLVGPRSCAVRRPG